MKLGYPCLNWSLPCNAGKTFRLKSYSDEKLIETVDNNLSCLMNILQYNKDNGFYFFRISSETIPFASHEICQFNWQKQFENQLQTIGKFILKNEMRISMHPDQFVLINALDKKIIKKSIKELQWHCELLDLMGLKEDAKVQIHVGGVYDDKQASMKRFVDNYKKLPELIKKRLVIENDDRLYSLKDCIEIHEQTNIPIIFDNFHHECLHNDEPVAEALSAAQKTWTKNDGILMTDYSSQQPGERVGKHRDSIDIKHFEKYIKATKDYDFDIMLKIKDKEKSAAKALQIIGVYSKTSVPRPS